MKQYRLSSIILGLSLVFSQCKSKQVVYYELPAEMSSDVRTAVQAQCEKGLVLYRLNCAKCHSDTVKGKEVIPDFSPEQLSNYEFRFANKKHEDNLNETQLTQDELVCIIAFLTYKKKNKT